MGGRDFYPRPLGGGRPIAVLGKRPAVMKFLSTPSGWRATKPFAVFVPAFRISIHALRVEGDCGSFCACRLSFNFYPRPPGGGRPVARENAFNKIEFLSTPSGWRATCFATAAGRRCRISIHALRVEGDSAAVFTCPPRCAFLSTPSGWRATRSILSGSKVSVFLSTPSGWRATLDYQASALKQAISIHALRVEGDEQHFDDLTQEL